MSKKQKIPVGIDLGTTYCSISYYDETRKETVLITDKQGESSTPSWVSFSQMDKSSLVVGKAAKDDVNDDCVVYDAKRIIGRDIGDVNYEDKDNWPFKVKSENENGNPSIYVFNPINSEMERFEPEEITGIILKYLFNLAEERLVGFEIGNVVVTVPPAFNDRQRIATETACKLAGIKTVEFVNEASAAVIEYKRTHTNINKGSKIVVIDFGGTLDVSCCLVVEEGNIKVESNGGDQNIGGNNFDHILMELIKEELITNGIVDEKYYSIKKGEMVAQKITRMKRYNRLRKEAERVKIIFSSKNECELSMDGLLGEDYDEDNEQTIIISRKGFEDKCEQEGLYERFINKVKEIAKRKNYLMKNVDLVLLIGGCCKMPRIRQEVEKLFEKKKFADFQIDPLTAVAKGAAYIAFNKSNEEMENEELFDTIPYPIGIEINGGKFEVIIEEGMTLPCNGKPKLITTTRDYQDEIVIKVFKQKGKYLCSSELEYIATLHISNIPKRKLGEVEIEVIMSVNRNGRLELISRIVEIHIEQTLRVKIDLTKESEEFIELKKHFEQFPLKQLIKK